MKKSLLVFLSICVLSLNAQEDDNSLIWQKSIEALQKNDWIKGVEMMNIYLRKNPANPYVLFNRGVAFYRLGDIENACKDMNKAKELGFEQNQTFITYMCNSEYKIGLMKNEYYKNQELLPENGNRPVYTRKDTLRGALRPERTCFDVYFYDLSVRILTQTKSIVGNNKIYFHVINETKRIQLDLSDLLQIDSILWQGRKLKYSREYDAIWVDFPEKLIAGTNQMVLVYYKGAPRIAPKPPWDGGFDWKHSSLFTWHIGVACEHLGASVWWPNKDHLSDKPDSMAINIEVPKKYQAVCNGRLRQILPLKDKFTRYEWFVDYPINNYNATFYMGKFAEFTDTLLTLGDTLVCRYHVLPKNLEIAKTHFKQAHEVVDFYNKVFGPFPFWKDNFRMVESPFEGMEHQTAIAYGNGYSNSKSAMTYLSKNYDYIIVHEAAHEWWGNSVAAADMADVWIHEGFATYSEYMFLEEKLGYLASIKELQNHMIYIFNIWPMVQHHNVNENSFASGDIYYKGATMLHCLRSSIANDSIFFGFIRGFYTAYKGKTVYTSDFLEYAKTYFTTDYTPLFKKFLYDKDIPVLNYSYKHTPEGTILKYKWTEVPEGFSMPFAVEFANGNSERLVATTTEQEFLLKDAETFSFFNLTHELDNVPKFGFTYYNTHCDSYK